MELNIKTDACVSVNMSFDELKIFIESLKEVLTFVPKNEFFARIGCQVSDIEGLLKKMNSISLNRTQSDRYNNDLLLEDIINLSQAMNAVCHRFMSTENINSKEKCYALLDNLIEWIDNTGNLEK